MGNIKRIISYFIILLVFLDSSSSVYSLATDQCNHNKTAEQIITLVSCIDTLVDKHMESMIKEYKEQLKDNSNTYDIAKVKDTLVKVYDDVQTCAMDFASKCANADINNLAKLFFEGLKPIIQEIDGDKADEFKHLEKFGKEAEKVFGDKPEEYLDKIVKSDKSCSIEKIFKSIDDDNVDGCLEKQVETLEPLNEYIDKNGVTFPKYVSVCQTMDTTVNTCLFETSCISTQEMTLVQTLAVKVYQMALEKAAKIKEQFGTFTDMITTAKATKFQYDKEDVTGQQILDDVNNIFRKDRGEDQAKFVQSLDSVLDDYNGDDCKLKVAALVKKLPAAAKTWSATGAGSGQTFSQMIAVVLVLLPFFFN